MNKKALKLKNRKPFMEAAYIVKTILLIISSGCAMQKSLYYRQLKKCSEKYLKKPLIF